VSENQPIGTAVGTFSTTDPDAGDTFTNALVSGSGSDDNGSFTITGNTLYTAAIFDYETKNSYNIRVRSTDQGGLYFERLSPSPWSTMTRRPHPQTWRRKMERRFRPSPPAPGLGVQ